MEVKYIKDKEEPKGGWLGPPIYGRKVPALGHIGFEGKGKKRKPILIKAKLSKKDKKKRDRFFKRLAEDEKSHRKLIKKGKKS